MCSVGKGGTGLDSENLCYIVAMGTSCNGETGCPKRS